MLMRSEPPTRAPSMLRRLALATVAAGIMTGAGGTAAMAAPDSPSRIPPLPTMAPHRLGPQQEMCPYTHCRPGPIRRQPVRAPWSLAPQLGDLFTVIWVPLDRPAGDLAPPRKLCPVHSWRCSPDR